MTLAAAIQECEHKLSEKKPILFSDIASLASAVYLEEKNSEQRPASLLASATQSELQISAPSEQKATLTASIETIKKAKKIITEQLTLLKKDKDKNFLETRLSGYYNKIQDSDPKKIIDPIISNIEVSEITHYLEQELKPAPATPTLEGVEKVMQAIKKVSDYTKKDTWHDLPKEEKKAAQKALECGNARLVTYANDYISYLARTQPTFLIPQDAIDSQKRTLATIIQLIFEANSPEVAITQFKLIASHTTSPAELAQLYDVCLHRIKSRTVLDIRKQTLDLLNQGIINKQGVLSAYALFDGHASKSVKISLARVILSGDGIDDKQVQQVTQLEQGQLMRLASVLDAKEASACIIRNKHLTTESHTTLPKMLEEPLLATLQQKVEQGALALINSGKQSDARKIDQQLQALLEVIVTAEETASELKVQPQSVIKTGLMAAEKKADSSFIDFMKGVAQHLQRTASSPEASSSYAELSRPQKQTMQLLALTDSVAHIGAKAGLKQIERKIATKEELTRIIDNSIHVLSSLDDANMAAQGIQETFKILLATNNAKCIEIACDLCLEQKNAAMQFACGKALLAKHSDQLTDLQIDALIKRLAETSFDKSQLLLICRAQATNIDRIRLTAALLRNVSMRAWALTNSAIFQMISSDLIAYCKDGAELKESKHGSHLKEHDDNFMAQTKQLFANWSHADFDQALSLSITDQVAQLLRWGSLTRQNAGGLNDAKLKAAVQQLDLTTLTARQIAALDKRSRIAILKDFHSWEAAKQTLRKDEQDAYPEKIAALVHDFEAADVRTLQHSEAGLIALFQQYEEEVAAIILEQKSTLARKTAWSLLQEIDQGFLQGEEKSHWWGNKSWLKGFIKKSVYEFDGRKEYQLAKNKLLEDELKENPGDFIKAKTSTPAAFQFFLTYPAIMTHFANTAMPMLPHTTRHNWLEKYLAIAAEKSHISPLALVTAIDTLANSDESEAKEAGRALITALPAFFEKNKQYAEKDLPHLLTLYGLYRKNYPIASSITDDPNSYQTDPIISALNKHLNRDAAETRVNRDRRKLLGTLYFQEPCFLEGYLQTREHHNKEPEEPAWITYGRTFLYGALAGTVIAATLYVGSKIADFFNPMNWFQGSSIWSKCIDVAKLAVGGAASVVGGGVVATVLAIVVLGAATVGVAGVLLHMAFNGGASLSTSAWHGIKRLLNRDVPVPGQRDYEIIKDGLAHVEPEQFMEMMYGEGSQDLRDNMARALWYIADKGHNINNEKSIPKEVLEMVALIKNQYKDNRKLNGAISILLKAIVDIPTTLIFVLSQTIRGILTVVDLAFEAVGVGRLFNCGRLTTPPAWLTYLECATVANKVEARRSAKMARQGPMVPSLLSSSLLSVVSLQSKLGINPETGKDHALGHAKQKEEQKEEIKSPISLLPHNQIPSPEGVLAPAIKVSGEKQRRRKQV